MSDDRGDSPGNDDPDGFDWLASQFEPTEQVPKQQPPAAATPAAPPAEPANKFQWGLRPGGAEDGQPESSDTTSKPTETDPEPPEVDSPLPPVTEEPPPTEVMTQPLAWDDLPGEATQPSPVVPGPPTPPPLAASQPVSSFDQPTQAFVMPPWDDEPDDQQSDEPAAPPEPVASNEPEPSNEPQPSAAASTPPPSLPVAPPTTPLLPPVATPAALATEPTSAIDNLFAENRFREYEETPVLPPIGGADAAPVATSYVAPTVVERAPLSQSQKVLMIVAGSLLALAALVALYFLGQRLGSNSVQTASAGASSSATAAPSQAPTTGLAAPGVRPYSALMGGECVNPFTTAWQSTYTVVDCTTRHAGQLIFKGILPDAVGSLYPDAAAFRTEITPLCSSPTALDYDVAKPITDLQVSFSYPATSDAWAGGDRTYYCFVARKSGTPMTRTLAGTQK